MKLFIRASFLFPSQSVLLSVNEQTNLKSFSNVNSLELDSRSFVLLDFPIRLF